MKNLSVKFKVTLWYTLAMILVSSLVLLTMHSLNNEIIERDISSRIEKTVEETSRQFLGRDGRMRSVPGFVYYAQGVHMALYDANGNSVGGQIPFSLDATADFMPNILRTEITAAGKYYIYDKPIRAQDTIYWLKGVVSVSDENYSAVSSLKTNLLVTIILICIAAIGGYFIISRAFVPVNKISKTAREIADSNDLTQRINIGAGRDEICALANTFDEMLEKIEKTFNREKQFTSDASHELRTPVAVILSECEYMTDCAKTTEEFLESADVVKRQAKKMSKLISELLTISRMDKNTLQLNFEETDISELLGFVCDEQIEIHDTNILLERKIVPGITAKADRSLLSRLFINLISNAYQYSKETGTITVSLSETPGNVICSVADTGIGISQENLPKIWERFYQVDDARTANESGSMGLGLSMVKWIAQCHGGSITVNSELGKGSEFVFTFPKEPHNLK